MIGHRTVTKCRLMEGSSNAVVMLWRRKTIEMESILNYARKKDALGMTGAMSAMSDESRGLFCVQRGKRIAAARNHRSSVKGKRINLERMADLVGQPTPTGHLCLLSLLFATISSRDGVYTCARYKRID